MWDQAGLGRLGDRQLLAQLSSLVRRSNELTSEVLAHLIEVEARLLFAELGFSSMFAYCTERLGLSESAAWRRILSARVCRRFPEVFERVARGELHLSAVCSLAPHLTEQNAGELFEACRGKKRREVDELLAKRFPKADVRERITRQVEPLAEDRFGLHFTADREFVDLLERARGLVSHRLPNGDLATVLKLALRELVTKLEKQRFGVGRRPRSGMKARSLPPGGSEDLTSSQKPRRRRRRRIRAAVSREVYARDNGRCGFVSEDGRRCDARAFLQLDHVAPHAKGGSDEAKNLRVYCQAHNQLEARRQYGSDRIHAAIARSDPGNEQPEIERRSAGLG